MTYTADYITKLQDELFLVAGKKGIYNTFTTRADGRIGGDEGGRIIQGATESDVIKHLTSKFDFETGRKTRFPGIGNGWNFESVINAAGFRLVSATNFRNQTCRVVTL